MAPEQCLKSRLSPATDVYGLGAMLYEMLTGKWPFEEELLNRVDRKSPEDRFPQISLDLPLSKLDSTIPRKLAQVVRKSLARDPRNRFQSVRGLLKALVIFLTPKYRLWPDSVKLDW
jgi:serine/threonine-protein kinase